MAVRRFVVLGLGSFGTALALRLTSHGCRVTGVDLDLTRLEEIKDQIYEPIHGDVTSRQLLQELLLNNAESVFISLGESIERSILAALHCRELGAKHLVVKGISSEHEKILRSLGVERVVFPEVEFATQLADTTAFPNQLETLKIDPEYGIIEVSVPTIFQNKTLAQLSLRRDYDVSVLAIKDALQCKTTVLPPADFMLNDDQMLIIIGRHNALQKFRAIE